MLNNLKEGDLIYFYEGKQPYTIKARNDRYIIATRLFNRIDDANLVWHGVEVYAFLSFNSGAVHYKNETIYTIIDTQENIRGTDNYIFGYYDYSKIQECYAAIESLENGENFCISHRNRIDLYVSPKTTFINSADKNNTKKFQEKLIRFVSNTKHCLYENLRFIQNKDNVQLMLWDREKPVSFDIVNPDIVIENSKSIRYQNEEIPFKYKEYKKYFSYNW